MNTFKTRPWTQSPLSQILICAVLFFAIFANGDTIPHDFPEPKIVAEPGHPYRLVWANGDEAILKISKVDSPDVAIPFEINDNDCSDFQGIICQYKFRFTRYAVRAVWFRNLTHPERVGQIVKYAFADSQGRISGPINSMEVNGALFGLDRHHLTQDDRHLPAHEIECPDFSWLPSQVKSAPAQLHVIRWDGEGNHINPETGASENRTDSGAYDLDFERSGPQTLKLTSVGATMGLTRFFDLLNVSPTLSITITKRPGQICQAGASSNALANFLALFQRTGAQLPKASDEKPYIVGTSALPAQDFVVANMGLWILPNSFEVYSGPASRFSWAKLV